MVVTAPAGVLGLFIIALLNLDERRVTSTIESIQINRRRIDRLSGGRVGIHVGWGEGGSARITLLVYHGTTTAAAAAASRLVLSPPPHSESCGLRQTGKQDVEG